MHEELFQSPDRPFRATPDTRFYFPHENIETSRQTIVRAVQRAEGPVMVLGGAGLGKSLLGMVVAEDLSNRFDVVTLHAARLCSRRALLQCILFELQLPHRDLSEGDLRLSILARLEPSAQHAPDGVLLLIDEAHTLPAKLLDELRLITNFTRNHQPRARLVLIGNLRLEHMFAEPQMESFNQRLAARCYLQPMNRQQTGEYVRHQLTLAGVKPMQLITEEAIHAVYAASDGVPRLANQIMDHALVLAITRNQSPLSAALVEEAWADLQQLPAPWHSGAERLLGDNSSTSASGADGNSLNTTSVEFGSLDDDDDWGDSSPPVTSETPSISAQGDIHRSELKIADPKISPPPQRDGSVASSKSTQWEDDGEELRLADEPLGVAPPRNNFFAAFAPADAEASDNDAVEHDVDSESTEMDLAAELPSNIQSVPMVPPTVDKFFHNRPTDEQLLAFTDEQQGYDAMGVWENDPPLSVRTARRVQALEPELQASSQPVQKLFGDDFDEEVNLTLVDSTRENAPSGISGNQVRGWLPSSAISATPAVVPFDASPEPLVADSTTARTAKQAAEAADYVARIQQFADAITARNRNHFGTPMPTVDEILADSNPTKSLDELELATDSPSLEAWSVDVSTLDYQQEIAVQSQIEDIVSQLNFAAFAVEPYSVEHIPAHVREPREPVAPDSTRLGKNDEIYTLHRPLEPTFESSLGSVPNDSARDYDDDRSLLIIDEELPSQSRNAVESSEAITKIAPYSQLFAKLRK
jgi:type II secretory pathway predicted ATPase ExeA